jgi:pyridoxal phosphate enzyme (YggS family)
MSEERDHAQDRERGSRTSGPAERLEAVRNRIRRAAERASRDPAGITLVAVSKTFAADRVLELAAAGQTVFGENRVQEARDKIPAVNQAWSGPPLTWRLIGHLQRNKVKQALGLFGAVDSVDSFRLLDAIAAEAAKTGRTVPVLLEFNCSGEASKGGFEPEDFDAVARRLAEEPAGVDARGFLTIGPLADDPETARPAFRRLREIRDRFQERLGREFTELSMGMSGDLEIGIEEGATQVRVGTALFGSRD